MEHKEKAGIEIERKYIIEMPDLNLLCVQPHHTESRILQIYLPSQKGETHRLRRRIYPDRTLYIETRKQRVDAMSCMEYEREIDEAEFDRLSKNILEGSNPIEKTRHSFTYLGQLFEVDIYPLWHNTAIMETELACRDGEAEMPPFIKILREVTGIKAYSNASMARAFPKEDT